ncbi:MAG: hypothetical protein ACPG4B_04485 [Cycloclasticus sp.]
MRCSVAYAMVTLICMGVSFNCFSEEQPSLEFLEFLAEDDREIKLLQTDEQLVEKKLNSTQKVMIEKKTLSGSKK